MNCIWSFGRNPETTLILAKFASKQQWNKFSKNKQIDNWVSDCSDNWFIARFVTGRRCGQIANTAIRVRRLFWGYWTFKLPLSSDCSKSKVLVSAILQKFGVRANVVFSFNLIYVHSTISFVKFSTWLENLHTKACHQWQK